MISGHRVLSKCRLGSSCSHAVLDAGLQRRTHQQADRHTDMWYEQNPDTWTDAALHCLSAPNDTLVRVACVNLCCIL